MSINLAMINMFYLLFILRKLKYMFNHIIQIMFLSKQLIKLLSIILVNYF